MKRKTANFMESVIKILTLQIEFRIHFIPLYISNKKETMKIGTPRKAQLRIEQSGNRIPDELIVQQMSEFQENNPHRQNNAILGIGR